MIVVENLVYHIQGRQLIDDVFLTPPDGEIIVTLGPNGVGKSTLLRQLTGHPQPHSGRCSLSDKPLNEWPTTELARTRVVMRQNSHMAFPFSVQEVIRMGRYPYRTRSTGNETEHIMMLCNCQVLATRDYRYLSGGEQQRVQPARLLVQLQEPEPRPKWLFLDEPTLALDTHYQQHLFRLLRRLVGERQFSVCCALHDLNLAACYADCVALMEHGRMVDNGCPQGVLQQLSLNALYGADLTVMSELQHRTPLIVLNQ